MAVLGAWWTLFMFNLHIFWSMGVFIGLVEALFPADAEVPRLGPLCDWTAAAARVKAIEMRRSPQSREQ